MLINSNLEKWLWSLFLALALAGCQQAPPAQAPAESAAEIQQRVLRKEGFLPSDQGWELQMSGKLLFAFDSADVGSEARTRIMMLGQVLSSIGVEQLIIEGYTDDYGGDAYNLRLSQRRAEAVAQLMVEAGIPKSHIQIKGLGRSRPIAPSNPAENRRVAIIVTTAQ